MPPPPHWSYRRPLSPEPVFSTQPLIPHHPMRPDPPWSQTRHSHQGGARETESRCWFYPCPCWPYSGTVFSLDVPTHHPEHSEFVFSSRGQQLDGISNQEGQESPEMGDSQERPRRWGTPRRGPGAPPPTSRPDAQGTWRGCLCFFFQLAQADFLTSDTHSAVGAVS